MEMAALKVQNSAIKFAQILEDNPKIRENTQKAEENAKNDAQLDKFELLQWKSLLFKNNLTNVKIDRLMESVYLAFNGFVKALNEPKCQNIRQLCPMAMPATTGRRRRRQMDTIRGTFGIEQPPQAPQGHGGPEMCTCGWCQFVGLLVLGILSFISIIIAYSMLKHNASHQNILFMCGSVAVFLCSVGAWLKVYTTLCNNCCANNNNNV
uniref:Uncharacterized protein n=1 Tax=Globodera rostochiensis TaxID=31243 RepID=A0A914GPR5_GLORO